MLLLALTFISLLKPTFFLQRDKIYHHCAKKIQEKQLKIRELMKQQEGPNYSNFFDLKFIIDINIIQTKRIKIINTSLVI